MQVINSSWEPNGTELLFSGIMTDLVLTDCSLPESPVTQSYFDEMNEFLCKLEIDIFIIIKKQIYLSNRELRTKYMYIFNISSQSSTYPFFNFF